MSTVLTLEQFNHQLEVLASRFGMGKISTTFNPSLTYEVKNTYAETGHGRDRDINEPDTFYSELRLLGCRAILHASDNTYTHPYLYETDSWSLRQVSMRNLAHLAEQYPELRAIREPFYDAGLGEWVSSNTFIEDKKWEETVMIIGKLDPGLTFFQAETIAKWLRRLSINEFKYKTLS